MSRFLQYFNLAGVAALAILCAIQWQQNSRINQEVIELEKVRLEQAAKIAEQANTIKGDAADLEEFRQRLVQTGNALKESDAKLAACTAERSQLTAERDQLKATLDKWVAAVAERDKVLKQASDELVKLAKDRNEAVLKFNDLAGKYNGLVKDLNDARAKLAAGH